MFQSRLSINDWLTIPRETRLDLVRIFSVPRSTGSSMQDNVVLSDGHTYDDLAAINCISMSKYLGLPENDEPFEALFQRVLETIAKAHQVIAEEASAIAQVIAPILEPIKIPVVDIPHEESVPVRHITDEELSAAVSLLETQKPVKRKGRPPGSKNK